MASIGALDDIFFASLAFFPARVGQSVTLKPGQSYYEGPNDIHTAGRNASLREPAQFLMMLLKNKDTPVLIPEQ
jgi:hypothetical protein